MDRCTTCHVALQEASLVDVKTQPFRPHPPIPHKLTEFGCVLCHRGQGAATTVEEAHSSTKSWEEPILPAGYLESGCGQCHLNRLTGTPKLNQGRDTLAQYGCVRCHMIKTPDGVTLTGTDDPPSLEHIAEKTSREWIAAWLKNPQAYSVTATMPNFQFKDDEIRDISAFLIAQSTPYSSPLEPAAAKPDDAAMQDGSTLYGESFCTSCHATQNAAGNLVGGNARSGTDASRFEGQARMAGRLAARSQELRSRHERCRTTASTANRSACSSAFLGGKDRSGLRRQSPLRPAQCRNRSITAKRW